MPTEPTPEWMEHIEKIVEDAVANRSVPPLRNPESGYLTRFQAVMGAISITVGLLVTLFTVSINVANRLSIVEYQNVASIEDRHSLHAQADLLREAQSSYRDTQNSNLNAINARLARIETLLADWSVRQQERNK